jgi:hypothetical protein
VEKIVHNMTRTDFRRFREMAIDGLLEATFYEYLGMGCDIDEAEALKPSLRRALTRWWNAKHSYASPVKARVTCTGKLRRARPVRQRIPTGRILFKRGR